MSRHTVGILGGGQLAQMLALAARPLDVSVVALDPGGLSCPAASVAEVIAASFDDVAALAELASRCDVVTVELEAVPVAALEWLAERIPVRPGSRAVGVAQDRLLEKQTLRAIGLATAPFDADVPEGEPAIVKTRRGGYDGRGQVWTSTATERADACRSLPDPIVEGVVAFDRELSLVAVRGVDGGFAAYPLVENHHRDGILRTTVAPAPNVSGEMQCRAERLAVDLLTHLDYVGVMGIELFQMGDALLVNEFAPRVHNTGHWTIEGAHTSQFEQHLRAVLGWPLGSTAARSPCSMHNIIGVVGDIAALLADPSAHVHLYGKEPRPGRKLGHVTYLQHVVPVADTRAQP